MILGKDLIRLCRYSLPFNFYRVKKYPGLSNLQSSNFKYNWSYITEWCRHAMHVGQHQKQVSTVNV